MHVCVLVVGWGYLRRVRRAGAYVRHALRPLDVQFLLVLTKNWELWNLQLQVDQLQKLADISQKLLADAFARTVDGNVDGWAGEDETRNKPGSVVRLVAGCGGVGGSVLRDQGVHMCAGLGCCACRAGWQLLTWRHSRFCRNDAVSISGSPGPGNPSR